MIFLSGRIPADFVDEVRQANDIVQVISEYVPLKKSGRNFVGLCPFHPEKTPSFTVSPEKQIFYCFGCHEGGDVISFLMKREGLSFWDALTSLARRVGLEVPATPGRDGRSRWQERAYEINAVARDFFHSYLRQPAGQAGKEYFFRRELTEEDLERFYLGFAPAAWDELTRYMTKKGFREEELVRVGLAVAGKKGSCYDRFRNRVIFPITNHRGQVAGFGGRVLDDSLPKYLNSPESDIFNKGQLLYGLSLAARDIRQKDEVILVEGYMDVIRAHKHGFTNTVAPLGTALTREQVRLITRYTYNVVMAFDADTAGQAATLRGLDLLQEAGCRVRVVTVPAGKDPDEFLQKEGGEAFARLLQQAEPLLHYRIRQAGQGITPITVEDKLKILHRVLPALAMLESEIQLSEAIYTAADLIGLTPEAVRSEVEKFLQNKRKRWIVRDNLAQTRNNRIMPDLYPTGAIGEKKKPAGQPAGGRQKAERELLTLLLNYPDYLAQTLSRLEAYPFTDPLAAKLWEELKKDAIGENLVEKLVDHFREDEEILQFISRSAMTPVEEKKAPVLWRGYVERLLSEERKARLAQLLQEIKAAEQVGDWEKMQKLLLQYRTLLQQERSGES
ncbi:MAG: primase [Eubacteriales bacterium]|nr:primase [Eubacteriales bacterium]